MTKPIESFFDFPEENFSLWREPKGTIIINHGEILFQAPLNKISKRTGQWKEHYFVLTKENLYFLKSEKEPIILAVMNTDCVRCDYIYRKNPSGQGVQYCIKFIKNMRFVDLWTNDESHFLIWKE